jgi:hypothetical protein
MVSLRATEGSEAIPILTMEIEIASSLTLPRPRHGGAGARLAMTHLDFFNTLSIQNSNTPRFFFCGNFHKIRDIKIIGVEHCKDLLTTIHGNRFPSAAEERTNYNAGPKLPALPSNLSMSPERTKSIREARSCACPRACPRTAGEARGTRAAAAARRAGYSKFDRLGYASCAYGLGCAIKKFQINCEAEIVAVG